MRRSLVLVLVLMPAACAGSLKRAPSPRGEPKAEPARVDASVPEAAPPPPRVIPAAVPWSELGPPTVITRGRRPGHSSPSPSSRYLFPAGSRAPEPFGVILVIDQVIEVWTPSHSAPIASRPIAELYAGGRYFNALAAGHGLFLVQNEREVIALDAETLKTRWRYALLPGDKSLDERSCAITSDRVHLNVMFNAPNGRFELRVVDLDHAGAVLPGSAPFPDAAQGIVDGDVAYSLVEGAPTDNLARFAFVARDTATGKPLWSTRERVSFRMAWGSWQATRSEVLFYDAEDAELVAIDRVTHAEKWYAPLPPHLWGRFVFANDGQAAIYAESEDEDEDGVLRPSVVVFRTGKGPSLTNVHAKGRVVFQGNPVAGAFVRARTALTRSRANGTFDLVVPSRASFVLHAFARNVGPKPCRTARRDLPHASSDLPTFEIPLQSDCDSSDE